MEQVNNKDSGTQQLVFKCSETRVPPVMRRVLSRKVGSCDCAFNVFFEFYPPYTCISRK